MTYAHRLDVAADGDVVWGPDPADITAVAAAITAACGLAPHAAEETARVALVTMHERQAQE